MFNKFFLRKLHSDDVPIKCYVAKFITLQRILFSSFLTVSAASSGWMFTVGCAYTGVKFTCEDKIEATYERQCVNVTIEPI